MNRILALFLIGLIFGGGIGFTVAAGYGVTFDGHDHSDPAQHGAGTGGMDHAMMHETPVDVPTDDAPGVSIMLTKDAMAGYNLHLMTRNFTFAPQNASGQNVTGEGHAHVYINGVKRSRLYGEWMHLDGLPEGEVEVKVVLNTNDHRPITVNGEPAAAVQTITVE